MGTKMAAFFLAAIVILAGCATQPTVAPGPLGQAQKKLTEARSLTKPTEIRIADYFEAAGIAEQEVESRSRDAATNRQAKQLYNDAAAGVTVLLEEADHGKYWNHPERIGAYQVRFQPGGSNGLWSPGFYGHGGYQSPESIAELLRILRLHVDLKATSTQRTTPTNNHLPNAAIPVS